ncbi:hypothetical protein KGMB03357_01570 [Anaerotignum faecicola]|uniref:Uncharacterized protein n=1 Tax=Anaerotignum faecicola TaxID=2358141 RepID=A0A401LAD6_9FIRM|nr:hypothetical protein KGMB03357_01570 [Anaerotignum faecicola]
MTKCAGQCNQCQVDNIHAMRDRKISSKEGDARNNTKSGEMHNYCHGVFSFPGIPQEGIANTIGNRSEESYAQGNKG